MNIQRVFDIQNETDFETIALEIFRFQYQNTLVYQNYVDLLNTDIQSVDSLLKIPFLPIEIYKNHSVLSKNKIAQIYFQSSGTTHFNRSKHWVCDLEIYHKSIALGFEQFIGKAQDFVFLGLLPSYTENEHSSLIYMVNYLMKQSNKPENAYYLYNHHELNQMILSLEKQKKTYCLFGVSFALLDFLDEFQPKIESGFVIETGGMKGRKIEVTKDELLFQLKTKFKTEKIYSEYSMTELLSQAYSLEKNQYQSPNWMRFLIRSTDDPFSYMKNGQSGAINILDLANLHSCSFIATQDLGKLNAHKLEVLGRIDHSDIRGCSQLA